MATVKLTVEEQKSTLDELGFFFLKIPFMMAGPVDILDNLEGSGVPPVPSQCLDDFGFDSLGHVVPFFGVPPLASTFDWPLFLSQLCK